MIIETQQQYDDACAEFFELCSKVELTPQEYIRLQELDQAIIEFTNAKWGRESNED